MIFSSFSVVSIGGGSLGKPGKSVKIAGASENCSYWIEINKEDLGRGQNGEEGAAKLGDPKALTSAGAACPGCAVLASGILTGCEDIKKLP